MKPKYMYEEELDTLRDAAKTGEVHLSNKEALVLRMRADRMSTLKIGQILNLSRQRVHQIEQRAVNRLEREGLLSGSVYRTA